MATADVAAAKGKGFTLIELMAALAILALLLLLGIPSFIAFLRNSEIRSTAESIINGLRTGKHRGDAPQFSDRVHVHGRERKLADQGDQRPGDRHRVQKLRAGRDPGVCGAGGPQRRQGDGHARRQDRRLLHRLGRVFNQGTGDHIRLIDIESTSSSERRASAAHHRR
jgi:prepilin-type N-terminal cleavage/methylation domain-containing protein